MLSGARPVLVGSRSGPYSGTMLSLVLLCAVELPPRDSFKELVEPFVKQHCFECHSGKEPRAELGLDRFQGKASVVAEAFDWESVRDALHSGEMPPADRPQPTHSEASAIVRWIEEALDLEPAKFETGPGRVLLRRLNRTEYRNTIRDLFDYDFRADERFPRDEVSAGFDNVAESLAMPAVLFEKYLFAAEEISRQIISVASYDDPPSKVYKADKLRGEKFRVYDGWKSMHSNGVVTARHRIEEPGIYRVLIRASAQQAGPDKVRMELRLKGRRLDTFVVEESAPDVGEYSHEVTLDAGRHEIGAAFTNDYYKPDHPDPEQRDRNLLIKSIEIVGPIGAAVSTDFQERFEAQYPKAKDAIAELARRIYRRPASGPELRRLSSLSKSRATWAEKLRPALTALLASPHFLYKVELDRGEKGEAAPLSDWELATRLSYFLWASTPDEELFRHCEEGDLHEPEVLRAEVRRMLRDPRSSSLSSDFAAQWLKFRNLSDAYPDRKQFETWTDSLREAMQEETRLFFETILREDRPIRELLDADFTFVNEELAKHYGIGGVQGEHMRRVRISKAMRARRGGLLTQAGILTANSNPTRSSPVLRGKWIMETILGTPPPAPPPGVDDLAERAADGSAAPLKQRLAEHRENPQCAVCHTKMDALGLSLENFDAIGRWRTRDGRFEIDASAELPTGERLEGVASLRSFVENEGSLVRTFARALATYALGRSLNRYEQSTIDEWASTVHNDITMREIIEHVVFLEAFRLREAEDAQ